MLLHLAHGAPALGDRGGTELYADALVQAQRADGQDSALLVPERGGQGLRQLNGHTWAIGVPQPIRFRETWSRPEVASAVRRLSPTLVHAHHFAHLGMDALDAVSAPLVLTLHDYHLLCARGQLMDRDIAPCTGPSLAKCGTCVAEHLALSPGMGRLGTLGRRLGVHHIGKRLLAAAGPKAHGLAEMDARIQAGRRILARAAVRLSPSRDLAQRIADLAAVEVKVLDLPLVAPLRPAPVAEPGPLRVLYMGALIPSKGVHLLEAACARLELDLQVWGPAPVYDADPDYGERLIQALGARYRGVFDAARRQQILDHADVLVVPSLWEENSPLVVREALAAGLRVVASDKGGIAEIDPRIQCFAAGDPTSLRAILNREQARGRGRWVPRDFSMAAHVKALTQVYATARTDPLR